jgi:hypothetical protein
MNYFPPHTPDNNSRLYDRLVQDAVEQQCRLPGLAEFNPWFFRVATEIGILTDEQWRACINTDPVKYRQEQLVKLNAALQLCLAATKTMEEIQRANLRIGAAIRRRPPQVTGSSAGGSSGKQGRSKLTPDGGPTVGAPRISSWIPWARRKKP